MSNEEGQENKWKHKFATLASLQMYSFESSYDFSMKNDNTSNLVAHLEEIQYSGRWTAFSAFVAYHSQSYTLSKGSPRLLSMPPLSNTNHNNSFSLWMPL